MSNIYIEDFLYVIDTIKSIHPIGVLGLSKGFLSYVESLKTEIKDKNSLIHVLSLTTAQLKDGHTNIEIPYKYDDLCLNIPCRWFNHSLYVIENYKDLQKGDVIEYINKIPAAEYLKIISNHIPHENEHLVKVRTTQFPYQNYHLFSLLNLEKILGNNTLIYEIEGNRNGSKFRFYIQAEPYNGCADFIDTVNFMDSLFVDKTAVLILSECKFDDSYKKGLDDFFRRAADNNINHIILDLSDNMGGNSMVTQEFLKYLNVDTYRFYDVSVRKPYGEIEHTLSRNEVFKNEKVKQYLYNGKVSCLVSNTTFSSARIFAAVLKDNNIVNIIGEHTGGMPTSYGAPSRFETPNLKIKFRVSARIFKRPNNLKDEEESLVQDIYIPKTIDCFEKNKYLDKVIRIVQNSILE